MKAPEAAVFRDIVWRHQEDKTNGQFSDLNLFWFSVGIPAVESEVFSCYSSTSSNKSRISRLPWNKPNTCIPCFRPFSFDALQPIEFT